MKTVELHHEKLGTVTVPESAARVMARSGWYEASTSEPEPEPQPNVEPQEPLPYSLPEFEEE